MLVDSFINHFVVIIDEEHGKVAQALLLDCHFLAAVPVIQ